MKVCSKCKIEKDNSLFYQDKRLKSGLSSHCSDCHALKRARQRATGYIKHYHINRRYGLNREDYNKMYESQNGVCKICNSELKSYFVRNGTNLVVDHDHKSGKVRGLICSTCNLTLGKIEKYGGIQYLSKLLNYLQ